MLAHRTTLTLLAIVLPLAGATARSDEKPSFTEDSFVSGDKKVRVERFDPPGKGPHPLVVLLPGIDGLEKAPSAFRGAARSLAGQGFVVLLPYYHDRTATNPKQVDGLLKQFQDCLKNPSARGKACFENRRLFREWEGAVCDALAHGRTLKNVDPHRVVLVGYSLGGFLATAVAARPDQEIAALAARPDQEITTVIHGKLDTVVSVAEARRLTRLLEEKGVPWDDWVHPMLGHGLVPRGSILPDRKAVEDAQQHAVAFVWKHIGRGDGERVGTR